MYVRDSVLAYLFHSLSVSFAKSVGIIALTILVRGENANQAIMDIWSFLHQLLPHIQCFRNSSYPPVHDILKAVQKAIVAYEGEMYARSKPSVLASRQACLDAHQYERINEASPLIAKRIMVESADG